MSDPERDEYFKDAASAAKKLKPLDAAKVRKALAKAADPDAEKDADEYEAPFTNEDLESAYLRLRRLTSMAGNEGNVQMLPSGEHVVFSASGSGVSGLYCLWNWGVFRRLAVRSARNLKRRSHAMAKRASRAAAAMLVDTTGDGRADSVHVDTSGDGRPDTIVPLGGGASAVAGEPVPAAPVPPQYLCPITGEVMEDPVTTADGHAYERAAIAQWLQAHDTSPVTNAQLPHRKLAPAHALRQLIEEFVATNPEALMSTEPSYTERRCSGSI